jgi:hypothetical protein
MSKLVITLLALFLVPASALAADRSDGERLVESLYRQFAWEAVLASGFSEPGLVDQPQPVLERFFTPELARLIVQDREEVARSGEIARLDFLPLWDAQDPSAADLNVTAGDKPNTVVVSFRSFDAKEQRQIVFVVEETPAGIRIADIEYPGDYSLASLLKAEN